jgi:hypothetical protein
MPRTEDIVRLRHMLDAARKAVESIAGWVGFYYIQLS